MEDRPARGSGGAAHEPSHDPISDGGRAAGFRDAYPRTFALGLSASAAIHAVAALALGLGDVTVVPASSVSPTLTAVELLPPAPPDAPPAVRIPPPSLPVPAPPEPEGAPVEAPEAPPEPVYIAHDVAPRLVNVAEVRSELEERYPAELPAEAAGSQVVLWLFVNESGDVTKLRVRASSGWGALDRLAQEVAPAMRFRPALHMGRSVGVWVSQPIRFRPPPADGAGAEMAERRRPEGS